MPKNPFESMPQIPAGEKKLKEEKKVFFNYDDENEEERVDGNGISRRKFVEMGGVGLLGVALSRVDNVFKEKFEGLQKAFNVFFGAADQAGKNKSEQKYEKPTPEQEKIEEIDARSVSEIVDYDQKGRIRFDRETVGQIKQWWKEFYTNNPNMRAELEKAFYEMGAWRDYLQKEFEAKGFSPEEAGKLLYLAIPESHWQLKAVSKAAAVGPYQFTKQTAKDCGLTVDDYFDERQDPIMSARACAHNLKYLLENMNQDLDIALSGYNGSFVWAYRAKVLGPDVRENPGLIREREKKMNYDDYLEFIENKLNKERDKIRESGDRFHKVKKGDTGFAIAKRYKISIDIIEKLNPGVKARDLEIGMKLKVGTISEKEKRAWFNRRIAGYKENLVYPAKFHAIIELINEGLVYERKPIVDFEEKVANEFPAVSKHTVKAGEETMYGIAKKYPGTSWQDIAKANPKVKPESGIHAGLELDIPSRKNKKTLKDLAYHLKDRGVSIQDLCDLNPAIKNSNTPIESGHIVRILKNS